MPYPLAELPYGLRCRLSELSSPLERYNLQIAAGNLSVCPPKLQIAEKGLDHLCFRCENGTVSVYTDHKYTIPFTISADSLTILKYYNILNGFDVQSLKSDIFDHFIRDATGFGLKNCTTTKSFWETLKMMFPKVMCLDIHNDSDHLPISFTDMLTVFPNIETLDITCHISKNWMEEMSQFGKQTLIQMGLTFDSLELCDKFDCDRFVRFVKAQRPDFNFFIYNIGYPGKFGELHLAGLTQYLDLKFTRDVPPIEKTGGMIAMYYENDCHAWFLPLFKRCSNLNIIM